MNGTEAASGDPAEVCIIGAGGSGIAACRALSERGIAFDCFEKGSTVGGQWRYDNDSGLSSAYASVRTNSSRDQTQFAAFPMPKELPDYPGHEQMARYFDDFVDHFGFRHRIEFSREVERVTPLEAGGFEIALDGGEVRSYEYVIVASGHDWDPFIPELPGQLSGPVIHSREYRTPEPYEGKRVAVVGFGNSATEIASELVGTAKEVLLSVRGTMHVLPRYILRWPIDLMDTAISAKLLPWWFRRLTIELLVLAFATRISQVGLPPPPHKLLHDRPTTSDEVLQLIKEDRITVKAALASLDGDAVRFADGSRAEVDALILATGYRLSFPFLPADRLEIDGREMALYRRMVHPPLPGVFFVGIFEAIGGWLPVSEAQGEWIADVIAGGIELPSPAEMARELEREDEATRRRFAPAPRHSMLMDRHPYIGRLARDRRSRRGSMARARSGA